MLCSDMRRIKLSLIGKEEEMFSCVKICELSVRPLLVSDKGFAYLRELFKVVP